MTALLDNFLSLFHRNALRMVATWMERPFCLVRLFVFFVPLNQRAAVAICQFPDAHNSCQYLQLTNGLRAIRVVYRKQQFGISHSTTTDPQSLLAQKYFGRYLSLENGVVRDAPPVHQVPYAFWSLFVWDSGVFCSSMFHCDLTMVCMSCACLWEHHCYLNLKRHCCFLNQSDSSRVNLLCYLVWI